jgi:DNA-binding response OmpR family regulator
MAALNVLVVEDDAMIGMLLAEMLGDMGYNVCAVAATEDDAVADAARCKPGLMIVDELLREGNGSSAVARILLDGPVPCVFISGAPLRLGQPAKKVLRKPFVEGDLVRAIRDEVTGVHGPADGAAASGNVVLSH